MTKAIDTLIDDIYNLLTSEEGHKPNQEWLAELGANIAMSVSRSLLERRDSRHEQGSLRISGIGRPERQVWYEAKGYQGQPLDGATKLKFLQGHILEDLLIYLAKEAGHTVTNEQKQIEIEGVKGHADCTIDGVDVDLKTASPYSFKKFADASIFKDDSFGYVPQLSSYHKVLGGAGCALWAIEKSSCEMTLLTFPEKEVIDPVPLIKKHKENLKKDTPPARCYTPEPDGKSGNMALHKLCSYCAYRDICWKDSSGKKMYRSFKYANGTVKHVLDCKEYPIQKEPKLEEVT